MKKIININFKFNVNVNINVAITFILILVFCTVLQYYTKGRNSPYGLPLYKLELVESSQEKLRETAV